MGCAATCLGYELEADLDFNTDTGSDSGGAAVIDADDDYHNLGSGWEPLGDSGPNPFRATFEGNNHTINNLFINVAGNSDNYIGLFGQLGGGGVRRVHLVDAKVTGNNDVGALVGHITLGTVSHSSSSGTVSGVEKVGGLVGTINSSSGTVEYSRSSATVTGTYRYVGGLVGRNAGYVRVSYATGAVTGLRYAGGLVGYSTSPVSAAYATGAVNATRATTAYAGGLFGWSEGSMHASYSTGAVTSVSGHAAGLVASNGYGVSYDDSYWDVTTSGIADDNDPETGVGKTTMELQSPTQTDGYAGIYADWNIDIDRDSNVDDPWDFGTSSEYPALKADSDGDGAATAYEFGRQGRSAPPVTVDYDTDGDNLIEIATLAQLNAIRHDLDGNGDSTHADYTGAFSNAASGMGCAATCLGYELTANLDFNTDTGSDSGGVAVIDSDDDYHNSGAGWAPIGDGLFASFRYNAIFDGGGHTISNLFINRLPTYDVGLFGATGTSGKVRNVGLEGANVTGSRLGNTGALIGTAYGTVDAAYSTGSVTGTNRVGGLVGYMFSSGSIQRSYSTASVTASGNNAGGLVALSGVGSGRGIRGSYATGAVSGTNYVGGLVGHSNQNIIASYARGAVNGTGSNVGGLVGMRSARTITNSYWDVTTSTQADDGDAATGEGKTTSDLATPQAYGSGSAIYANWNLDLDSDSNADDPWDFGTASEYPALKADFNRDSVKSAVDGDFGRQPRAAPVVTVDYDTDGDNLIEVSTLAQLNAIRYDLDGNGDSTHATYTGAFPNAASGMGCAATCLGYELTTDLDFNTDTGSDSSGAAVIDSDDDYYNSGAGWASIGGRFTAIFNGNGHVIKNLFINRSGGAGLFNSFESRQTIGNLGLENVNITGGDSVGPLASTLYSATVERVYATGSVTGRQNTGGLVGFAAYSFSLIVNPTLRNSYSRVAVTGTNHVGGLVGFVNSGLNLTNSYFAGTISGTGADVGSLVGRALSVTATRSYWDGDRASGAGGRPAGASRTTSALQTPTGATGIYSGWSAAIWDFGTASEYPALKYDTDENGLATWQEFGRQARSAPAQLIDYDRDDDGLIDVDSLAKLHAVRWDLDGNGASTNAGYALAFPNPETGMGCPVTTTDADDNDCTGYELTADLDFDTHGNDDTVTAADAAYWNGGSGWDPIGSSSAPFAATFDGAGHAIANLFINRGSTDYLGLFSVVHNGGRIRNLGLEGVKITGRDFIGAVAGEMSAFSGVEAVYVTGAVSGRDLIGGLIGEHHPNASLRNSYSAARVTGSSYVGGLLGYVPSSNATVYYSYARGVVTGQDSGGLLFSSAVEFGITGHQTYWDTQTSGQATSNGGTGQTTSNLKTPTDTTTDMDASTVGNQNIYSSWPAATWDFGTAIQYPALKYDTNKDGRATWQEFGRQPRSAANGTPTLTPGYNESPTVAEGARLVGNYPATDPDGDTLTYGVSGTDGAAFSFTGDGVLSLKSAADHERKDSYSVTVWVMDSKDAEGNDDAAWDDSIDLTVRVVDDTSEAPGAPTGLTATPIAEGLRVTWTAPVRTDQPPVTGYGVEYKLSAATGWTAHPHAGTGTTARITGLTAGSTYNVRVRAVSHENPSGWTSTNGVPAAAGLVVDYDTDDDGLIEIKYLEQLNAMRWDEDGDGSGGGSDYDAAFPDAAPGMGCPSDCTGYELEADLNFDTKRPRRRRLRRRLLERRHGLDALLVLRDLRGEPAHHIQPVRQPARPGLRGAVLHRRHPRGRGRVRRNPQPGAGERGRNRPGVRGGPGGPGLCLGAPGLYHRRGERRTLRGRSGGRSPEPD